jgi:integrase
VTRPHHERPVKRVSPLTGKVTWEARHTNSEGRRPSAGTFATKREAQEAIDKAYGRPTGARLVGEYFETWPERYPRSEDTNETNKRRVRSVLDIEVEGVAFKDWPVADMRRKHILVLVDRLLRRGRAASGVRGVVGVLSAMFEDAITDELTESNPARGVRLSANDPRVRTRARPIRVWSWEQMHDFARAAAEVRTGKRGPSVMDEWRAVYAEPMIRTFSDAFARISEVLAIERTSLRDGVLTIKQTAHEGQLRPGTKSHRMKGLPAGERKAPAAPTLVVMLAQLPPRLDTRMLFPTSTGKVWRARNFYRDVWYPTQRLSGLDIRPHEMRHSALSLLRRETGVDEADLADMAGHDLATLLSTYTHSIGTSFDAVREAIG